MNNRRILILLIIILMILLFRGLHTPTPSDTGTISGTVTLDGVIQPGILVTLYNADQTQVISSFTSDANGLYVFNNVPYGNYHLQAYTEYANGSYVIADADVTLSLPVTVVNLALVKIAGY